MGVMMADIGGGTSDMSVFLDGNIWHSGVVPVGGFQFTRDISIAFTTPFQAAEMAKLKYGNALPDGIDTQENIWLPGFGDETLYQVSRQRLCQVLHERVEELLQIVMMQLHESGLERLPPGGLVLTGGAAKLPGLEEMARSVFSGPIRIGVPRAMAWVPQNLEDPSFATALGLLLWDVKHQSGDRRSNSHGANGNGKAGGLSRFKRWVVNLTQRGHK